MLTEVSAMCSHWINPLSARCFFFFRFFLKKNFNFVSVFVKAVTWYALCYMISWTMLAGWSSGNCIWTFLFLHLSACLCPTLFFSSSIHVTHDKVQHSCPYIDLCSVWSGLDLEDGAHAQTQHVHTPLGRLRWVLRHLDALGNVNLC